jgi:hypothetical protein
MTGLRSVMARDSGRERADRVVLAEQGAPQKAAGPAPSPPAPYVPFTGASGPSESWYPAFLPDLAVNGGISLAAAAAGVHRNLVYRRIDSDPIFAEEVEVAKAYYRDLLGWESVNLARRKDNPLPFFARLKAEMPARYIDRQAVMLASSADLTAGDGQRLLQATLSQLTPESMRQLGLPTAADAAPGPAGS